jgi:large subunit ribosomal protein L18
MSTRISAQRRQARLRRHARVRRKVSGTPDSPRLAIFRSARSIYAQVIDDVAGHTLASASSMDRALAGSLEGKTKSEQAAFVGTALAEKAKAAGIESVVFDRGGYRYHGRVKALAEAAREAGLKF